jgi:hypothetical protein
MGFDVYGLEPTNPHNVERPTMDWSKEVTEGERDRFFEDLNAFEKAVPGHYFRNNVWWWRPLWEFISGECKSILSENDIEAGYSNGGHCISKTKAKKIAARIRALHKKGLIVKYKDNYEIFIEELPDEDCGLCDGTGLRMDKLGIEKREKDPNFTCNACNGKGKNKHFARRYPFYEENVLEFGKFCEESGGFQIC